MHGGYISIGVLMIGAFMLAGIVYGESVLIGMSVIIAMALVVPFTPFALIAFTGVLLGLSDLMSGSPIPIAGIKVYGADAMLYFLGVAVVWTVLKCHSAPWRISDHSPVERLLFYLLIASALYGLISVVIGMKTGHTPNDALGDYRRYYVYPLALLLPLFLPQTWRWPQLLRAVVLLGGVCVILTGIYRLWCGTTWQPEYFGAYSESGRIRQLRLLSHTEVAVLGLTFGYLSALAIEQGKSFMQKLSFLAAGVPVLIFLLLSGWRLGLLYVALVPVCIAFLHTRSGKGATTSLMRMTMLMLLLIVFGALAMYVVIPDQSMEVMGDLIGRTTEKGVTDDMRFYAWKYAIVLFVERPLTGIGLGDQPNFLIQGSDGAFWYVPGTIHNIYVSILYLTGLPGFILFSAIHGVFITSLMLQLPKAPPEHQSLLYGIFSGYLCIMAVNALQPLQTGGIVALYLLMGYAILLCSPHHGRLKASQ